MTDTVKVSMRLDPRIIAVLQSEASALGREIGEHMQRLVTDHVLASNSLDQAVRQEFKLRRSLIERVEDAVREIIHSDGFSGDITHKTVKACEADVRWLADYTAYVGDNPYKHGNPRKGSINREIGARICRAVGGKVVKNGGFPTKVPVSGSIIQSYTLLESESSTDD